MKVPLLFNEYQLGSHYLTGQAFISSNQKQKSVDIDYENVEQIDGLNFHIKSHKYIYISQAVPKMLRFLIPKAAQTVEEFSETNNVSVYTYYEVPQYQDKVKVYIKTEVSTGNQTYSDIFTELQNIDQKQITEYKIDFKDTISKNQTLNQRQEYITIWKLLSCELNISFGSILTQIAGKQMKKIYTNNTKYMLEDYPIWIKLDPSQVQQIRQGKNVQIKEFQIENVDNIDIKQDQEQ